MKRKTEIHQLGGNLLNAPTGILLYEMNANTGGGCDGWNLTSAGILSLWKLFLLMVAVIRLIFSCTGGRKHFIVDAVDCVSGVSRHEGIAGTGALPSTTVTPFHRLDIYMRAELELMNLRTVFVTPVNR